MACIEFPEDNGQTAVFYSEPIKDMFFVTCKMSNVHVVARTVAEVMSMLELHGNDFGVKIRLDHSTCTIGHLIAHIKVCNQQTVGVLVRTNDLYRQPTDMPCSTPGLATCLRRSRTLSCAS